MTETETMWMDRVAAWRASGKTAEAFTADEEYEASTLRYWASRLKRRKQRADAQVAKPSVVMARVVRARGPTTGTTVSGAGDELAVVVGGARISVARGFDAVLLRELVAALGGGL